MKPENLRAARLAADIGHIRSNTITDAECFARDQIVAADNAFATPQIDNHIAVFCALDDAINDFPDPLFELVILAVTLGIAHLLHDHLLGRLRRNASQGERRQFVGNRIANLRCRVGAHRILQRDFHSRVLDRLNNEQMPPEAQFTSFRVDFSLHIGLLTIARACCFRICIFHRCQNDLTVNGFLACDRISDLQEFEPVGAYSHVKSLLINPFVFRPVALRSRLLLSACRVCPAHVFRNQFFIRWLFAFRRIRLE